MKIPRRSDGGIGDFDFGDFRWRTSTVGLSSTRRLAGAMRSTSLKTFSTNDFTFLSAKTTLAKKTNAYRRRIIVAVDVVIVDESVYGVDMRLSRQLIDDFVYSLLEIVVVVVVVEDG